MPRITPSDGAAVKLKDHEPYHGLLVAAKIDDGTEAFPESRLQLDWQLAEGDPEDTIRDWASLKLGQVPGGDVAKLRQLLNALVGKPETTKIAWFDSDTLEWGYEEAGPAFCQLTPGLPVIFRGKNKPKQSDPTQLRYRIETYQPAAARPPAAIPPPPSAFPPPPTGNPPFLQVSPDGRHGWTGTAWVEIAAAPPPPPPAPIPPPPPPADAAPAASNGRRRAAAVSAAAPAAATDAEPPF